MTQLSHHAAAEREDEDGMDLGLGTESTTAWAIAAIGWKRTAGEFQDVHGVATSIQSHELAKEAGIPLVDVDEVTELDLAIDGADQWDPDHPHIVTGGAASHAREKLIDAMAGHHIQPTKWPDSLTSCPGLSV